MGVSTYLGNKLVNTFFDSDSVYPFQNTTPLSIDYILLAGGGGGGFYGTNVDKYRGGGGGAGGLLTGSAIVSPSENIIITIGTGGSGATDSGANTSNGGNSTIQIDATTYYTIGGGGAGTGNGANINGKAGGSGGGGGLMLSSTDVFLSNGTGGSATQISTYGYGLGQPGCGGGTVEFGGSGGSSVSTTNTNCPTVAQDGLTWFDGLMYGYAGTGQVSAGQNLMTRGFGGNVNYNGGDGICVIRYPGGFVKATGGTITYLNGYTYHTFTNNGTFAYN